MAGETQGTQTSGNRLAIPMMTLPVYNPNLLRVATPNRQFENFVVHEDQLMKQKGDELIFTTLGELEEGGRLSEGVQFTTETLTASQTSIRATEWGHAMGISEKNILMSPHEWMSIYADRLGMNYSKVYDKAIQEQVMSGSNVIFAGDAAGRSSLEAGTHTFDTAAVNDAMTNLSIAGAPMFPASMAYDNRPFYVAFIHPHQASGLRNDPDFTAAQNFNQTGAMFKGTLGRWMDVLFVQTTNMNNGAYSNSDFYESELNGAGVGSTDVFKATVFGDQAVGVCNVLTPELRYESADLGREHKMAWYSIAGIGKLKDDFIQIIETA